MAVSTVNSSILWNNNTSLTNAMCFKPNSGVDMAAYKEISQN
jgi:hypothetical protein